MNSIENALSQNQSYKQNRVRIMNSDDQEILSSMFLRKEDSCKIDDEYDYIVDQNTHHENSKQSNEINISPINIFDRSLGNSHILNEKENTQHSSRIQLIGNTSRGSNNLEQENKNTNQNESDTESQNENQKKNIIDMDNSIQFIENSSNLLQLKRNRSSRNIKQDCSLRLIQNSSQNKSQPINMQKELMNRFLLLYGKQKNQITTLDRLKGFFEKYTTYGRARIMKKNPQIRKNINDLSDGQNLIQENGFFNGITRIINKYIFRCQINLSKCRTISKYSCFFIWFLKKFIKFSQGTISQVEFFKPHNSILLTFNLICIAFNFIFLYSLSLLIVFEDIMNIQDKFVYYYFIFTFIMWIIEFLVRINTAEIFRTHYIQNRMKIFKSYAKSGLILDFIPLLILLASISQSKLRPFIFLKYFGLRKDVEKAEKSLLMRLNHHYYIQMFNLTVNIFIFGHVIGLFYYLVAIMEIDYFGEQTSWLETRIAVEGLWYKTYLQSVYWSFTLLTTGSNEVETWQEMFFTTFIMMYTGVIFAYIFNTIGNIVTEMSIDEEEKKKDINIINNYMRRRKISRELQHKANEDLEFFYQTSYKKQSDEEKDVLSKISIELTNKMQLEYNKKIINKIKVLTDNFSSQSIDEICLKIDESFYSPNQIIVEQDNQSYQNPQLIIILSGSVEIFQKHNGFTELNKGDHTTVSKEEQMVVSIVKEVKKGETIGQTNFFNGQDMQISIRSQDFTTVMKIDREQFIDVIKKNQKDFEKFNEIKDKIMLYQELKPLKLQCTICKSSKHCNDTCPLCHFRKDNFLHISRHNKSQDQERNCDFQRYSKFNYNAYLDMYVICQSVHKIHDEYQFDSIEDQISFDDISHIDEEVEEDEEEFEEKDHVTEGISVGTYTKGKDSSQVSNQQSVNQNTQLLTPVIDQQNQLLNFRSRRQSRDHSFMFQEKNFISISHNTNSHSQLEANQNSNFNNNIDAFSPNASDKSPSFQNHYSSQQQFQKIDENSYRELPSQSQMNENRTPIFLRRRKDLTIISQLKSLLKDNQRSSIKEGTSNSQSKFSKPNLVKQGGVIADNQFLNYQNQEKIRQQNMYWYFDQQQDYLHYFTDGNMHAQILKYNNHKKKQFKDRQQTLYSQKDLSPLKKRKRQSKIKI